jgi:hypothetical protein
MVLFVLCMFCLLTLIQIFASVLIVLYHLQQFDWATKEITKNLQTSNYESEHQKHGEVSKTSFEEKDPYYSLYGR